MSKKERTARGHTFGRFFLRNLVKNRAQMGEKCPETPKNAKNQHDNSIKIIVLIWSQQLQELQKEKKYGFS